MLLWRFISTAHQSLRSLRWLVGAGLHSKAVAFSDMQKVRDGDIIPTSRAWHFERHRPLDGKVIQRCGAEMRHTFSHLRKLHELLFVQLHLGEKRDFDHLVLD